uniref:hypothetical protein n=1 Tax=Leptospirillum ferrooxidans TaxID=180 RepID=UPI00155D8EFD|nr:hypothetical protein [Leptospirillum ferrooxidans]
MENSKLKIGRLGAFNKRQKPAAVTRSTHGPVLLLEAEIPDRPQPMEEHRPRFNFVF